MLPRNPILDHSESSMSTAPDHVMAITTRGEFNPKLPRLPPNPSTGNLIRQSL